MTTVEEDFQNNISGYERDMTDAQNEIKFLNSKITKQETRYIKAKLDRDQAKEKFRLYLLQKPSYETTAREEEIKRFKKVLPEVMEKI